MDKNVTIRSNDIDIERWRKVAELSNQSLNVWIVKTLNLEASIMEEAIIIRYAGTVLGCCSWNIFDMEGNSEGTVGVRMKNLSIPKNVVVDIFNKDNECVSSETWGVTSATKKEIGEIVVQVLEDKFFGIKMILNLNKISN